jgi:hypothetical protein
MQENVGSADRALRSIAGPLLLAVGFTTLRGRQGRLAGLATMIAGTLVIESAVTRVCPLNAMLSLDTR